MKNVTVTFQNSRSQTETVTFDVFPRTELTPEQRRELISSGAFFISREDWREDDFAAVEKTAARQAGIRDGESFLILRK